MRTLTFTLILVMLLSGVALAKDVYVKGYAKQNGTYMESSHRTGPNTTRNDNYSTRGNVNSYTGQSGTKIPDPDGVGNNPYVDINKRQLPGYEN